MLNKILPKSAGLRTNRRRFLLGATAVAGGFAVGFRPIAGLAAGAAGEAAPVSNPFGAHITITADNQVTIHSSQFDMGQGSYHGIATLVVEELGASWDQIDVVGANGNLELYGNIMWGGTAQGTGGSTTMATSFDRYRRAGAMAREMLRQAAAESWGVDAGSVTVEAGMLKGPDGEAATFGKFAEAAPKIALQSDVAVKRPDEWQIIGDENVRRFDSAPKTVGEHEFTIDLKLPGMLTAVMIHPPRFGGKVASFDGEAAKAVKGVVDVVATPRGVAVVGEHMWAALKGRELVEVTWDDNEAEMRGSADILAEYQAAKDQPPVASARSEGATEEALAAAATRIDASFEFPYLAHASMEPLNAVAHKEGDVLHVYGGHQIPDLYQHISATIAETDPANVRMHIMKTGGGFGRRGVGDGDVVAEAVMVAKAIGFRAPVKVQWTRENDMAGGRYRPAYVHKFEAGLDENGNLVAWKNHIVGQSIVAGTPFEGLIQNGVDGTSVEGASNIPYAIPNIEVGLTTKAPKVPVLWWRAVGSTHTAYAVECFLDEVCHEAGADPVEYRMAMLENHPRQAAVLKLAAEKAGWGTAAPEGRFRGVAVHESFSTKVAQVAEVSVDGADVRVHKVTVAVDCGIPVNPDTIRAQMEGGVGFGLGSILQEELTLTDGVVDQGNYDTYTPLRIDQMPEVEVHIVASTEPPTGVGEPGVPPIGPAVANAVFAATGRRIRTLPFSKGLAA
ncbi:MAG: xanthine dehydrogenase family protein molybdopterin-binding subunit [Pseudomonadota bacterium]